MYSHTTNPLHREAIERRDLEVMELRVEWALRGADKERRHQECDLLPRLDSSLRRWLLSHRVPVWRRASAAHSQEG